MRDRGVTGLIEAGLVDHQVAADQHQGDPDDPGDRRHTWGRVVKVFTSQLGEDGFPRTGRTTYTVIETDQFSVPRPLGIEVRFSSDGINWSATNPSATAQLNVRLRRGVDPLTSLVADNLVVAPGDIWRVPVVMAHQLGVDIDWSTLMGVMALSTFFVQVLVSPVDEAPDAGQVLALHNARSAFVPWDTDKVTTLTNTTTVATQVVAPQRDRAQLIIVNNASTDLGVGFGGAPANPAPGVWLPQTAIILPGGLRATYESFGFRDCYKGAIWLLWQAIDPTAGTGALVTVGTMRS